MIVQHLIAALALTTYCGSIAGPADMQPMAKYEIEMIVGGTPLHSSGGGGGGAQQYGYGGGSSWDQPGMYGGSYYGAQAQYDMQALMQQPYGGLASYYGAAAVANPYMAAGYAAAPQQEAALAAAPAEAVPTDPTAYYSDYWQYAAYYGEAAARIYYGAWSPPEGTPAPAGMVIPTPAATEAPLPTESVAPVPAAESQPVSELQKATEPETTDSASASAAPDAELDPEAAAAAWETYKKQVYIFVIAFFFCVD